MREMWRYSRRGGKCRCLVVYSHPNSHVPYASCQAPSRWVDRFGNEILGLMGALLHHRRAYATMTWEEYTTRRDAIKQSFAPQGRWEIHAGQSLCLLTHDRRGRALRKPVYEVQWTTSLHPMEEL